MKNLRIFASLLLVIAMMFAIASCDLVEQYLPGNDQPEHTHSFVEGKCECGASDPDYVAPQPEHTHSFVNGECECGESDPNYVPPHVHEYVDGKCECGANDPDFVQDGCVNHVWDENSVKLGKDATCTEEGYYTIECSECGYTRKYTSISMLEHTETAVVTPPECNKNGYTTYTCTVCGNVRQGDHTIGLSHNYEAVVTEPTFDAQGYTTYTCSVCGDYYVDNYVEPKVAVAKVEETLYDSLQAAIDAANGKTVTVLANIYLSEALVVDGDVSLTIDLNEYCVMTAYTGKIVEVLLVKNGAEVTVKNGSMFAQTEGEYVQVISAIDGAKVTIEDGAFISGGCTSIYATRGAVVEIKGGYYKAESLYNGMSFLIDINEAEEVLGVINISGGHFDGFNPANHNNDGAYSNKLVEGAHSMASGSDDNFFMVSMHEYFAKVTAPTCTEDGYTTYKCACGDSYVADVVKAGHNFVEGKCECGATDPNYVVVPLSNATLDCTTKDNRVSFSSEQQVWSQNGITLTLNRGEGTAYSDKAPVQFASKGSLTIEGTGIKTIVIETGNTTYGTYVSNCFNGQPGVASVSAKTGIVTIVLTEAVDVFTIEYLAKQGQIKTITINPEA